MSIVSTWTGIAVARILSHYYMATIVQRFPSATGWPVQSKGEISKVDSSSHKDLLTIQYVTSMAGYHHFYVKKASLPHSNKGHAADDPSYRTRSHLRDELCTYAHKTHWKSLFSFCNIICIILIERKMLSNFVLLTQISFICCFPGEQHSRGGRWHDNRSQLGLSVFNSSWLIWSPSYLETVTQ